MTEDILTYLAGQGLGLLLDGADRLAVEGPLERRDAERQCILAHKAELLSALRWQPQSSEPAPHSSWPDRLPCPSDLAERSAILEECTGCTRSEADRRALAALGLSGWGDLANGHAASVRASVAVLAAPAGRLSMRLTSVTRAFLSSPWFERSVASVNRRRTLTPDRRAILTPLMRELSGSDAGAV